VKIKLAKRRVRTLGEEQLSGAKGAGTGIRCMANSGRPNVNNDDGG